MYWNLETQESSLTEAIPGPTDGWVTFSSRFPNTRQNQSLLYQKTGDAQVLSLILFTTLELLHLNEFKKILVLKYKRFIDGYLNPCILASDSWNWNTVGRPVQASKGALPKGEGKNTPLDVQFLECLLWGQSCYYTLHCISKENKWKKNEGVNHCKALKNSGALQGAFVNMVEWISFSGHTLSSWNYLY